MNKKYLGMCLMLWPTMLVYGLGCYVHGFYLMTGMALGMLGVVLGITSVVFGAIVIIGNVW